MSFRQYEVELLKSSSTPTIVIFCYKSMSYNFCTLPKLLTKDTANNFQIIHFSALGSQFILLLFVQRLFPYLVVLTLYFTDYYSLVRELLEIYGCNSLSNTTLIQHWLSISSQTIQNPPNIICTLNCSFNDQETFTKSSYHTFFFLFSASLAP